MNYLTSIYKKEYEKNPHFAVFCAIMIVSFVLMVFLSVVTRGLFFRWELDVDPTLGIFSDHYDSMMYSADHPYTGYRIIYPALVNLMYLVLYWAALPYTVEVGETISQQFANSPVVVLGYVVYVLVSLLVLNFLIHYILDKEIGGSRGSVVVCCFLMATPMLYAIERGNCIIYSIIFMMAFLIWYRSENKTLRYISYVCLAIASGIKIFPVLLALLILRERRYREFVLCAVITVIVQVVPFIFFDGTIIDLVGNMLFHSSKTSVSENGLSIISWVTIITDYLFGITSSIPGLIVISIVLLFSFGLIVLDRDMPYWQVVTLLCCNLTIGFVNPTGYVFLNMIPAVVIFLATQKEYTVRSRNYTILFAAMFASVVMPVQVRSILVAVILIVLIHESLCRVKSNGGIRHCIDNLRLNDKKTTTNN